MTEQEITELNALPNLTPDGRWTYKDRHALRSLLPRLLEERKRLLEAVKNKDIGWTQELDDAIVFAEAPMPALQGEERK